MTTKRLAVLLAVIAGGFGLVFLLPKSAAQPFGILRDLPEKAGDWRGTTRAVEEKELNTLGRDTDISRKVYRNEYLFDAPNYQITVSLVLAGDDPTRSIHRPERCLEAQNWSVLASESVIVEDKSGRKLPVRRLHNRRTQRMEDGTARSIDAYSYYWFVGDRETTESHWDRFYIDNRDRLFRGVNQRWAFYTVTGAVPMHPDPNKQALAREWADKTVRRFIGEMAPLVHAPSVVY